MAASALLTGDGEGGLKGFLRGSEIVWITLEQDIAAEAMKEGEVRTVVDLKREGERFVDARKRALRAQGLCFQFGEQSGVESRGEPGSVIRVSCQPLLKFGRACGGVVDATTRPTGVQFGHDAPKTHSLVSADSL